METLHADTPLTPPEQEVVARTSDNWDMPETTEFVATGVRLPITDTTDSDLSKHRYSEGFIATSSAARPFKQARSIITTDIRTAAYLDAITPIPLSSNGVVMSPRPAIPVKYSPDAPLVPIVGKVRPGHPDTPEERLRSLRNHPEQQYVPRRAELLGMAGRALGRAVVANTVGRVPGVNHLHNLGQHLAGSHGHSRHGTYLPLTPEEIQIRESMLPINQDMYPNLFQVDNLLLIRARRWDLANAAAAEWRAEHGTEALPREVEDQIRTNAHEQAIRDYTAEFADNEKLVMEVRVWAAIAERNARAQEQEAAKREHLRATRATREATRPSGPGRERGPRRHHRDTPEPEEPEAPPTTHTDTETDEASTETEARTSTPRAAHSARTARPEATRDRHETTPDPLVERFPHFFAEDWLNEVDAEIQGPMNEYVRQAHESGLTPDREEQNHIRSEVIAAAIRRSPEGASMGLGTFSALIGPVLEAHRRLFASRRSGHRPSGTDTPS